MVGHVNYASRSMGEQLANQNGSRFMDAKNMPLPLRTGTSHISHELGSLSLEWCDP
jgi:hypothetical protein